MAMLVAAKLHLPPQDVVMWHHTRLIVVFGQYVNSDQQAAYERWKSMSTDQKKNTKKPKHHVIRFIDDYRLDLMKEIQKESTSKKTIKDFMNGST